MGFKPMTSAILVRCSTDWVMKPIAASRSGVSSIYTCYIKRMMWSLYDKDHMSELRIKNRSERDLCKHVVQYGEVSSWSLVELFCKVEILLTSFIGFSFCQVGRIKVRIMVNNWTMKQIVVLPADHLCWLSKSVWFLNMNKTSKNLFLYSQHHKNWHTRL